MFQKIEMVNDRVIVVGVYETIEAGVGENITLVKLRVFDTETLELMVEQNV